MSAGATTRVGLLGGAAEQVVALPAIGRSTSRVGFGTGGLMRIGSARRRQNTLAAALASGVTHFDTAPLYGFGEAERSLGRFLRGQRNQVTLTTKFGLQASPLAARLAVFQRVGRRALEAFPALRRAAVRNAGALATPPSFSLATVKASLEKGLRALQTDYVDFFLAHQASADALPDDDLIAWLEDTRRAAKILAFGVATDFDWLTPVLQQRPKLSGVVQFDSDLTRRNVVAMQGGAERLLITYGFIGRAIVVCRERLAGARAGRGNPTLRIMLATDALMAEGLDRIDDDGLGGRTSAAGRGVGEPSGDRAHAVAIDHAHRTQHASCDQRPRRRACPRACESARARPVIHEFGATGDGFAPDEPIWDLCIVGAGAAGLALASEFLNGPWRVLVLESGLREPDAGVEALNTLDCVGLRHDGWREGRIRALGGTTRAWGGQLVPLRAGELEPRPWVPDSGWPVQLEELQPYYRRTERLLRIEGPPYDETVWRRLGVTPPALDPALFCIRFSQWAALGRRNFAVLWRRELERSRNVSVLLDATAVAVRCTPGGDRCEAINARARGGVRRVFVLARLSLLAAQSRQPDCCWSRRTPAAAALPTRAAWSVAFFRIMSPTLPGRWNRPRVISSRIYLTHVMSAARCTASRWSRRMRRCAAKAGSTPWGTSHFRSPMRSAGWSCVGFCAPCRRGASSFPNWTKASPCFVAASS
jgi:Aldo/keto reductase family